MRTTQFMAIAILTGLMSCSVWADKAKSGMAAPIVEAKVGECQFKFRDFYVNSITKNEINTAEKYSTYVGLSPFAKADWDTFQLLFHCRPFEEKDNGKPAVSYAYKDIDQDVNNGAMRDPVTGKWLIHPIEVNRADEDFIQNAVQAKLLAKSRFGGQLDAVNATGYYRVENETFGEETRRVRRFDACLMRRPLVLCASAQAGLLSQPKKSLVPHVIKLLQTVEFVN